MSETGKINNPKSFASLVNDISATLNEATRLHKFVIGLKDPFLKKTLTDLERDLLFKIDTRVTTWRNTLLNKDK